MANQEHLDILAKGVEAWNAWRDRNDVAPDLRNAPLAGRDLGGVSGIPFTNAEERFRAAIRIALRFGANLRGADLRGADLRRADLRGADLSGANLQSTDVHGAVFSYTAVGDVDLSSVFGLDAVQHEGPSTIGIDTIYKSKGKIPESFLRGAGVPENFITYMKSLTGAALDFYSVFISYSTKDQAFADRLHAGVICEEDQDS